MSCIRTQEISPDLTLRFYEESAVVENPDGPGSKFVEVPEMTHVAFTLPYPASAPDFEAKLNTLLKACSAYRYVDGEERRPRERVERRGRYFHVPRLTPAEEDVVADALRYAPASLTMYDTFAPVFPGFYNTLFECRDDGYTGYADEEIEPDWDTFDGDRYRMDIAENVALALEQELSRIFEADLTVTATKVNSPRQYNYSNDTIDLKVGLSHSVQVGIAGYMENNADAWAAYLLEHCTSYNGFMSYLSNDPEVWEKATEGYTKLDVPFGIRSSDQVVLHTILGFILENEGYTDHNLYDDATGDFYYEEYFTWPDGTFDAPEASRLPQLPL